MKTLLLVCGLPGSGKTTLSKKLEIERNAIRFSPDEWISELLENQDDSKQRDWLRDHVEKIQWNIALKLLEFDCDIILENGFWTIEEREKYRKQAKDLGAKVEFHYLSLSFEELWKRVNLRNQNLTAGTFFVDKKELEKWFTLFEVPTKEELSKYDLFCHIKVF